MSDGTYNTSGVNAPSTIPLTMSSLEIAGLTGKAHKHVLADIRKLLSELGFQPAEFSARYIDGKGESRECYALPQRECLILVSGYSIRMRAAIIDRWQALEAALTPEGDTFDMRAVGGMVKGILAKQLLEIVPSLVAAEIATHTLAIRRGKTAGQIWKEAGFPPIRIGGWFSRKLREMNCEIAGGGCGELGLATARLFDPDKAALWLRNGGRIMVEMKLAERMGQGALKLVRPAA